jgi:hypothetical protein
MEAELVRVFWLVLRVRKKQRFALAPFIYTLF